MPDSHPPPSDGQKIKSNCTIGENELPTKWKRWNEWVAKNAKPKVYKFHKRKIRRTRFQKAGPMNASDWKRFEKWAKKFALPKGRYVPNYKPNAGRGKRTRTVKVVKKVEVKIPSKLRMKRLSQPKYYTEKYQAPAPEEFNFMPIINGKSKEQTQNPRKIYEIKKSFLAPELESDFWRNIEFPVMKSALKYKPSKHILELAKPRTYPQIEHCNVPKSIYPLPRRKMLSYQWKWHLRHLNILAYHKLKYDPPEELLDRGKKVPLNKLEKRLETLATPKSEKTSNKKSNKKSKKKSTKKQSGASTPRFEDLAKPKMPRKKGPLKVKQRTVRKTALSAVPTPRVSELAQPKRNHQKEGIEKDDEKRKLAQNELWKNREDRAKERFKGANLTCNLDEGW